MVERQAGRIRRQGRDHLEEKASVGDLRQARIERLFGARNQVPLPFARSPERALGVAAFPFFRDDEVNRGDSERGGITQNVAGGLRPRQADDQDERIQRRRLRAPDEG